MEPQTPLEPSIMWVGLERGWFAILNMHCVGPENVQNHRRPLEILKGREVSKAKFQKGKWKGYICIFIAVRGGGRGGVGVDSPNHKTIYGGGMIIFWDNAFNVWSYCKKCCWMLFYVVFLSQAADTLKALFASHQLYDKAMVCSFYPNVIFQVRKKYSDCCYC